MAVPLTIRQRFARKLPRAIKFGRQWLRMRGRPHPATRFVFVVGSQRSGTRLPLQVMDYAPEIDTYSEGSAPYFDRVLLQPLGEVEALGRGSLFPVVALKPICETHRVIELLDRFPQSRAIWIFRHYRDAVSSASVKWKSGREAVRRLASDNPGSAGWRAGGLTPEKLAMVRELYSDRMTLHEANAVMWYLRNGLFFDQHVDRRAEVLLVRYEDLVAHPATAFARLFASIDVPIPPAMAEGVRDSARAPASLQLSSEIERLCDSLHARLLAVHADTRGRVSA